jgi:hypothetical protein
MEGTGRDVAVVAGVTLGASFSSSYTQGSPTPAEHIQSLVADGRMHEALDGSKLSWSGLTYGGRRFVFNRELCVRATNKEGAWVFEFDELDLAEIVGFDLHYSGAELSFRQTFVACWDIIAQEDDDKLAHDAKRLKQALLALAKEL